MSNFNYDILVENINMQMKHKGVTQIQLAEIAGMDQPILSRAIGKNHTGHLTLEQLYNIAEYFGCSIDELMNYKPKEEMLTTQQAAQMIVDLDKRFHIRFTNVSIKEELAYSPKDPSKKPNRGSPETTRTYTAIYFPVWLQPGDFPSKFCHEYTEKFSSDGNYYGENDAINDFIDKYIPAQQFNLQNDYSEKIKNDLTQVLIDDCVDKSNSGPYLLEKDEEKA